MRRYETIFILDSSLDKAILDQEVKKVEDLIASQGGQIVKVESWGTKRLAYPIAKKQQGYYTLVVFEGEGNIALELERTYRLNESCLRWLTVICEEEEEPQEEPSPSKEKDEV